MPGSPGAILRRIIDELPSGIGPNLPPRMPKTKQSPKQNAIQWEKIDRPGYERPLYNLTEVAQAIRTEAYASRSIDKHREHVLRHGWDFIGANQETVAYIKRRMREISESMGRPVEREIRRAVRNFIAYSNGFLGRTRDRNKQYKSRYGIQRGFHTGLFSMNPTVMRYRRSAKNQVLEWYQSVEGHSDESVKPTEVVHFAFDQDEGVVLGVPFVLPVLDDIQTWRRFEEMAEVLVHKFAFPLYHHRIGDEKRDPEMYDDGTTEIGEAAAAVAGMAPEGHLFTSYRHVVEVVGAGAEAIDLKPHIEYWEARVLVGLNLSTVDVGRDTASRASAETISKGMVDRCAEYQEEFALQFTFDVVDELLLEGGYKLSPENRVYMWFPPIDREGRRAENNHYLALYQGNAITHDEMRIGMGKLPFAKKDWKGTYWEQIIKPSAIIKASDEPYSPEAKAVAASRSAAQPSNQFGVKPTQTKITKDVLAENPADLSAALFDAAIPIVTAALQLGLEDYVKDFGRQAYLGSFITVGFMEDCVDPLVQGAISMSATPAALASTMDFYYSVFSSAARRYAYARLAQSDAKRAYVRWKLNDNACAACKSMQPMKIRRFTIGQMLPMHDECVSGLEVADKITVEEYHKLEAASVKAGDCVDSLIRTRPNTPCIFGAFPVDDALSAASALSALKRSLGLTVAEKEMARSAIAQRMLELDITDADMCDAQEIASCVSPYDSTADTAALVDAYTRGDIKIPLGCSDRASLTEDLFAGPNRTLPMHNQEHIQWSKRQIERLPAKVRAAALRRLLRAEKKILHLEEKSA